MERKTSLRIALALTTIGGALVGCRPKVNDGDILTVARDTSCWQCPGGKKVSPGNPYTCAVQIDWGNLSEGKKVTASSNGYYLEDRGYVRVDTPELSAIDPTTGEEIELSGRICWVNGSDLTSTP